MTAVTEWEPAYARRAEAMKASEIRELLKVLEQPDIISFAGGIPDPVLFPAEAAASASGEALSGRGNAAAALQYSVSEGYAPLRGWIAGYMASCGVQAAPENIVITADSQQALDFLGKLLLTEGDTALVTAPTYLGALQAFAAYEPRYDTLRPEQSNRTPGSYSEAARKATTGGPLVRRLVLIKQATDLNAPAINQMVVHRLVSDGRHAELVTRARAHYRPKRDAMLTALAEYMPSNVSWTRPEGGFFIWLKLPAGVLGTTLLQRAIADVRVAFVPGAAFFHDGSGENTIRLSYSLPDAADIASGVRRLASLLR